MIKDFIWKTFEKTGDLNTYLLFKETEGLKPSIFLEEEHQEENVKVGSQSS